jgi:hypothetical protein
VRAYFRDFMGQLGISVHGFRLYSLRRGGAAWDFRNTGSIDRSLHRGRWGRTLVFRDVHLGQFSCTGLDWGALWHFKTSI